VGLALAWATLASLAGCQSSRIEGGEFRSDKGYSVTLPGPEWRPDPGRRGREADLTLTRETPRAGMLADATCDTRETERPLRVLSRQLVFGLTHRSAEPPELVTIGGREGLRSVTRGERDGTQVQVEAVVLKDARCVYDFLYVAPVDVFEAGRPDFRTFVESFRNDPR
jgi:hypothetical protein